MRKTIKNRSGTALVMPTDEEDLEITTSAMSDPDAQPLSESEWVESKRPVKTPLRFPVLCYRFYAVALLGCQRCGSSS